MDPASPITAAQPDRRSGQRYTLILRAGKLICAAGEFLCVLRDVSDKGLKARLFHPLPPSPSYEIELYEGARLGVEPVWSRGFNAGFRFAEGPVDVHGLLAEAGPFPKRHIRLVLAADLFVQLAGEDGVRFGRVLDVSQHGAQLEVEGGLKIGQQLGLDAEHFPPLQVRVRWRRGSSYGVVFQQGFRLDELAELVARLQLGPEGEVSEAQTA
jgi:PilZ domain